MSRLAGGGCNSSSPSPVSGQHPAQARQRATVPAPAAASGTHWVRASHGGTCQVLPVALMACRAAQWHC